MAALPSPHGSSADPLASTPAAPAAAPAKRPNRLIHFLRKSPLSLLGLGLVGAALLLIVFAPWLATHDPNFVAMGERLAPPSAEHWFGTDELGRDIYSRVVWGARTSVTVGLAIVCIALLAGSVIGALSGLKGGWIDATVMRLMDVLLSFPSLVLTIALSAALGPDLINAMLAVAVVKTPFYVRLARAQALSIRERPYVQAAIGYGASTWHLIRRHILPNATGPLTVQATLDIGGAILMAAALSFIGLGAQPPTAEWGAMIANGREYMIDYWWYPTFPGLAILLTAIGFNLLGDGLRDYTDPREMNR